jgi:hypothetical protein
VAGVAIADDRDRDRLTDGPALIQHLADRDQTGVRHDRLPPAEGAGMRSKRETCNAG